jgi:Rhodopirellula transposase DDE domain
MVEDQTGGDPHSASKWVRNSLRKLSQALGAKGHSISPPTVARLLRAQDFSLKSSRKSREAGSDHPERNDQFLYIKAKREAFVSAGLPVISIDAKKKELIGNFKNAGSLWCREAEQVNTHDFLSEAAGRATPYGIYDIAKNQGFVFVGSSADTAEFAVDAVCAWWEQQGRAAYPLTSELLILADGGGSNGYRSRLWKQQVHEKLCEGLGLSVTVCHYPRGCSKYNPIEHRLFSPISVNWAGKTLKTFETLLACIRGTTTKTGLMVNAVMHAGVYQTGQSVSDQEMAGLNLERHGVCPSWNYTIRPRIAMEPGT